MSAHTATPWTFAEHGGCFYVWGPGQAMVADGVPAEGYLARMRGVGRGATVEEQRANAAFIVHACNAHDDLLAALKLAVRYLEHPDVQAIPFAAPVGAAVERAQAAIAKAAA